MARLLVARPVFAHGAQPLRLQTLNRGVFAPRLRRERRGFKVVCGEYIDRRQSDSERQKRKSVSHQSFRENGIYGAIIDYWQASRSLNQNSRHWNGMAPQINAKWLYIFSRPFLIDWSNSCRRSPAAQCIITQLFQSEAF